MLTWTRRQRRRSGRLHESIHDRIYKEDVSQLAGFAKRDDLAFFLKEVCGMDYVHLPNLAPTQEMLDEYKKRKGDWKTYEERFLDLMSKRQIEVRISKEIIAEGCLL